MFEGILQPVHLLVVLAVVLLLFGPNRLPEVGRGLGEAIHGFRKGMRGDVDGGENEDDRAG